MEKPIGRICIVAPDHASHEFYRRAVESCTGLPVETYSSFADLRKNCGGKTFAGLIVDIRTLVFARNSDKLFFSEISDFLPVLRMRRIEQAPGFSGLMLDKEMGLRRGAELLQYFLTELCLEKPPRPLRRQKRRPLNLCLQLEFPGEPDAGFRSVTMNLSAEGCFVFYPFSRKPGDIVLMRILALDDPAPVTGIVRRVQAWNSTTRRCPGLGITFLQLSPGQYDQLSHWLS